MSSVIRIRVGGRTTADIVSSDLFDYVIKDIIKEVFRAKAKYGEVVSIEGGQFTLQFLSEDFFQCYGTGRKFNATLKVDDQRRYERNPYSACPYW